MSADTLEGWVPEGGFHVEAAHSRGSMCVAALCRRTYMQIHRTRQSSFSKRIAQ